METLLNKINNTEPASSEQNILIAKINRELDKDKKRDYLQYNHEKKGFGIKNKNHEWIL